MDTGFKISATSHGAFILLAIFGGSFFSADASESVNISEVSILTTEEFDKIQSGGSEPVEPEPAPEPEPTPEPEPVEPEVVPEPKVETEPVEPEPEEPVGVDPNPDEGAVKEEETVGEVAPEPVEETAPPDAPKVTDKVVEAPEEPVEQAEVKEEAVNEEAKPEEPKEEKVEPTAPEATTTEIVTEAEKKESELAPTKSVRPSGRPKNLQLAQEPTEEPKPATAAAQPKPRDDSKAIEDALAAAIAEDQSQSASVAGPPLTGSEKSGLVFAIKQCWNVPVGLKNGDANVITMSIKLDKDGKLQEEPVRIAPLSGNAAGILQGFDAARRALIRCQPYDLPKDKYETWREIEVVFDPGKMVLR